MNTVIKVLYIYDNAVKGPGFKIRWRIKIYLCIYMFCKRIIINKAGSGKVLAHKMVKSPFNLIIVNLIKPQVANHQKNKKI